ncbi:hypothetical protein ZWY2020_021019 [Hordeum vulgare]|nr:hypothetical protein ZWY2020_021019 [Hordeum vulgare]
MWKWPPKKRTRRGSAPESAAADAEDHDASLAEDGGAGGDGAGGGGAPEAHVPESEGDLQPPLLSSDTLWRRLAIAGQQSDHLSVECSRLCKEADRRLEKRRELEVAHQGQLDRLAKVHRQELVDKHAVLENTLEEVFLGR